MKNMIETFSALGARLLGFGDDDATRAVIDSACRANGWFTPADIRRAVRAIACDMLQREKLEAWLADYPALPVAEPRRVLVVMAGNIPLVGFFDLLCVLVSGHGCLVKPSAKDSVLMEHVVGLLREIDPSAPVRLYDGTSSVDAVNRHRRDQRQPLFPGALRRHSLPAAGQPPVGSRAFGARDAGTACRTGRRHLGLFRAGVSQRVADFRAGKDMNLRFKYRL